MNFIGESDQTRLLPHSLHDILPGTPMQYFRVPEGRMNRIEGSAAIAIPLKRWIPFID